MSLKYTLLGFLSYEPMTGYSLKGNIDHSTQAFWHASLGQIYPLLKKMVQEGLIDVLVVPQDGKPDKKYYFITDAGRTELDTWLREPLDTPAQRKDSVLLKLFFSGSLEKDTLLKQLERQLEAQQTRLRLIQEDTAAYIQQAVKQTGRRREGLMWERTRQFGEEHARLYIRWLKDTIEIVKKLEPDDQRQASP